MNHPAFRRSCRGLLIDENNRTLLLEHRISARCSVWVGPGGGIETGEEPADTLRRELFEETGFVLDPSHQAQLVWVQTAELSEMQPHSYTSVVNFYFLIRVAAFEPESGVDIAAAGHPDAEGILTRRWWSLSDITTAHHHGVLFSPRALPTLLSSLLTVGPPTTPVRVGL